MNKNDKASLPNPTETYKAELEKKLQTVQELLHYVDAIVWSNPPKVDIDDGTPKDNIQIDFPPIGVSLSQSQMKESYHFMRAIDDKRRKRFIRNSNGEMIPYKRTYDQSQTSPSTTRKKRGRPRIHSKEEIIPPPLVLSHVLNIMIKEILNHITATRIHMRKLGEDIYRDFIKPLGVLPPETVICYDYVFNILYRLNLININEIPKPSTAMNSTLLDESLKQLVRDGNISTLRQLPINLFNQAMSYIYLQSGEWKSSSSSYSTNISGNMMNSSSSSSSSTANGSNNSNNGNGNNNNYSDMSLSNDQTKLLIANEKIATAGNLLSTGAWIYRESNLLDWGYSDVRQWDVVPEPPHRNFIVNYNVGLFVSRNTDKKTIHYNHFHTLISFYTYQFKDPLVLLLLEQILESCLKEIWNVTIVDDSTNIQLSEMKNPRIIPSQISLPLNIKPNNNLLDCFIEDFNQEGNKNFQQQPQTTPIQQQSQSQSQSTLSPPPPQQQYPQTVQQTISPIQQEQQQNLSLHQIQPQTQSNQQSQPIQQPKQSQQPIQPLPQHQPLNFLPFQIQQQQPQQPVESKSPQLMVLSKPNIQQQQTQIQQQIQQHQNNNNNETQQKDIIKSFNENPSSSLSLPLPPQ